MRAKLAVPVLAAALVGLTACDIEDFGGSRYSHDFHLAFPLNSSGHVSVETFNGSVEITGWDQNTIDISGTKFGPTPAAAEDLQVDIDHAPDRVSIRVVRPSERRSNQGARLAIKIPRTAVLDRVTTSNGGIHTVDGTGPARLRTSNGSIRVDNLGGSLDAQTSNSSIEAAGIAGDAALHTSNGSIHAKDLRGSLDAGTSNGTITAVVSAPQANVRIDTNNGGVDLTLPAHYTGDLRADTSNRGITVRMPADSGAHLIARTSNASITSDFEMTMRGEISRNHVDGQIGGGGAMLELTTSNGGIRIVKM
jgi:DUF4097 and DUF4098 domain-containing protein YvlB